MSSWGNNDNAANVPLWAASTINLAPTRANVTSMFGNTTTDVFVTGQTIGIFGANADEATASHTSIGWIKRVVGSGGRVGRVTQEVLIALSGMLGDNENIVYPNALITITSQPANGSAKPGNGNTITYSVVANSSNTASTLNYYWQFNNGSVWANTATGGTLFTGNTSSTLTANAALNTTNTYKVRAIINVDGTTGALAVTSANATITIA
jgi:hypothetical protein